MTASRKLLNTYLAIQYTHLPLWEVQTTEDRRYSEPLWPLGHYGNYTMFESNSHFLQAPSWQRHERPCGHNGCKTIIKQTDRTLYTHCPNHFWSLYRAEWQAGEAASS